MSSDERGAAGTGPVEQLIERLLTDGGFRAAFRHDPAAACRQFGLDGLADELGGSGKAMHTLELRESKSSLAGALMAIAAEGMGAAELSGLLQRSGLRGASPLGVHVPGAHAPRLPTSGGAAGQLQRDAALAATPRAATGGGAPPPAAAAPLASAPAVSAAAVQGASSAPAPGGGASAATPAAGPAAAVSAAAAPGTPAVGAGGGAAGGATPPAAPSPQWPGGQQLPAGHGAEPASWPQPQAAAAASPASGAPPVPAQAPAPAATGTPAQPAASAGAGTGTATGAPGAAAEPAAAMQAPASGAAAPAAWPQAGQVAEGTPVVPAQEAVVAAGAPGSGATAQTLFGLLSNPHLQMPASARALMSQGTLDPRAVEVLATAVAHHQIVIGEVSESTEPVHAQAIEILSVDGEPVGPGSAAARNLVTEIAMLEAGQRPSEIETPWAIQAQGFYAGAPDRLRLGFISSADYQPQPAAAAAGSVPVPGGAAPQGSAGAAGEGLAAAATPPAAAHQSGPAAAIAYARSMLGKLPETSGPNESPALNRFEGEFGFHAAPWCGIFAGHALEAAGLKVPDTVASVASILQLAESGEGPFEKGVLPVSAIRPGDLVTFGGTEHVALVIGVDSHGIHTIAGNYENNVTEHTYPPEEVTGVVRPKYPAEVPGSGAAAAGVSAGPADALATAPSGGPSRPNTMSFHALGGPAAGARHTVKFLQAVQPAAQTPVPQAGGPGQASVSAELLGNAAGAGEPMGYPGDNAPKAEIARWMGEVAARHGLPRELPVMAALVESSLHNDAGGDRDSVGYFQMRTSIWNNGAYAGYAQNPALQLKWFIDEALSAKQSMGNEGSLINDPSRWGEWIANVERPAEEYRGRYQLQLQAARQLLGEA